MILRTFAIPTGEDPDKISSDELDEKEVEDKVNSETISEVDVSAMRRYFNKNGISEEKVLNAYKVKSANELNFGQFKAILSEKNLEYFKQMCGV